MSIPSSYGQTSIPVEKRLPIETKIKKFSRQDPLIINALSTLSPDLEVLIAQDTAWQLKDVHEFTHRIKRLKTLDVGSTSPELPSNHLTDVLKANQLIKNLIVPDSELDSSGLKSLSPLLTESLNIRGCDNLSAEDVINFLSKSSQIKELRLNRSIATSEVADAIAKYCPQLEFLDFSEAEGISEISYLRIARNCLNLKEIYFQCSENFSDVVLMEFLEKCPQLTKINVNYTDVTDVSLHKINQLNRAIHSISLTKCKNITRNGLEALLKVSKDSLEILDMEGIEMDLWMIDLLRTYHPPLTCFNLMSMKRYGSLPLARVLLEIIEQLSYPISRIQQINIKNFSYVDYDALHKLREYCPTIKEIYATRQQIWEFAKSQGLEETLFQKKFEEDFKVKILY
ncbi:MAG: hypothetical protein H0T62_10895 [Parachlamydiaceae bacterium]|nr:hypothetical protein [Parachlamydiaceae bacterium]